MSRSEGRSVRRTNGKRVYAGGETGFIGSAVVRAILARTPPRVLVCDKLSCAGATEAG